MTPPGKRRVALIAPHRVATFIAQDRSLLSCDYDCTLISYTGAQSLPRLFRAVFRADAVLAWFARRHAAWAVVAAKVARVPVATIVGGYEVVWLPEVPYGIPAGSRAEKLVRWVLRHSDVILPVSQSTFGETSTRVPDRMSRAVVLYNAVDTARFSMVPGRERRTIVTVSIIAGSTLRRKGLQLFRAAALRMPGEEFVLVGPVVDEEGERFVRDCPANLTWAGSLAGEALPAAYREARVYFQGSHHESFSLATAESMACGCMPVVSRRGALPEIVGEMGIYMDALTPESAVDAIRKALDMPESCRLSARTRIVEHFGTERRRRELSAIITKMIASRRGGSE